jgi:hypothetical protein
VVLGLRPRLRRQGAKHWLPGLAGRSMVERKANRHKKETDHMTDAQFEEVRKRVLKWINHYVHLMSLEDWDIKLAFFREGMESNKPDDECWASTLSVAAYWEYQKAIINVNCISVDAIDDDELEKAIIHELNHIVISPMHRDKKGIVEREEFAVSRFSRILYNVTHPKKEKVVKPKIKQPTKKGKK